MLLGPDRVQQLRWGWRLATAASRAFPHLVIIGAQKAGTTSLFHYLAQHPQVEPPFRKEVHFFDNNWQRGERWYRAHFPHARRLAAGRITLEASPLYLFNPLAAERMAGLLPHVKLVAILRNPVERAISHYRMEVRKNREPLSIGEALKQEEARLAPLIAARRYSDPAYAHFSYKRRGHYAEQLGRYYDHYPREQMLILGSDELFRDPGATLRRLFAFAGLDPDFTVPDLSARNTAAEATRENPQVTRELAAYFAPLNAELARLTGRDFGWD